MGGVERVAFEEHRSSEEVIGVGAILRARDVYGPVWDVAVDKLSIADAKLGLMLCDEG